MKASSTLLACFLLATALAGCAGGDDETSSSTTGTGTGSETGTGSNGGTGGPTGTGTGTSGPGNAKPTAKLAADKLSGAAPLRVNFTVEGKDSNQDNMTWELDADGDKKMDSQGQQTDFTKKVPFTFTKAGNYTAVLLVKDGKGGQANATAKVTVTAAGPGAPTTLTLYAVSLQCDTGGTVFSLVATDDESGLCSTTGGLSHSYEVPAAEPLATTFPSGAKLAGGAYISVAQPIAGDITVTLEADGTTIAQAVLTGPSPHTPADGPFLVEFPAATVAAAPAGSTLTMTIVVAGVAGQSALHFTSDANTSVTLG